MPAGVKSQTESNSVHSLSTWNKIQSMEMNADIFLSGWNPRVLNPGLGNITWNKFPSVFEKIALDSKSICM